MNKYSCKIRDILHIFRKLLTDGKICDMISLSTERQVNDMNMLTDTRISIIHFMLSSERRGDGKSLDAVTGPDVI
jgi:hypothetical protein